MELRGKISPLLYIDALKLLGRNENDLKNEIKIVQTISKDTNLRVKGRHGLRGYTDADM